LIVVLNQAQAKELVSDMVVKSNFQIGWKEI